MEPIGKLACCHQNIRMSGQNQLSGRLPPSIIRDKKIISERRIMASRVIKKDRSNQTAPIGAQTGWECLHERGNQNWGKCYINFKTSTTHWLKLRLFIIRIRRASLNGDVGTKSNKLKYIKFFFILIVFYHHLFVLAQWTLPCTWTPQLQSFTDNYPT